jgi:large subunit ribosomal protein L5
MSNVMQNIFLDKLVVNIGLGQTEEKLDAAKALLKKLTGKEAAYTRAKKRYPEFGIRKGQTIGTVVTLRGPSAATFFKSAVEANNNTLAESSIANNSVNFGIKEYIYFSGVKYDPKIGMLGLNVNASFARKGARVEIRKRKRTKAGKNHKAITREDLKAFVEKEFGVKVAVKE